ncbi:MAG TPA: restriction endonuclease subunit S [Rhodoferax sp.]
MVSAVLGDVAEVISGVGFPKDLQGSSDGDVPVFKVGDISKAIKSGTHFLRESLNNLSKADAHKLSKTLMPTGTIVFAKIGEGLKLNRRAVLSQPSLVDNNVMGLVPKSGVATSSYLYYFMQTVDLGTLSRATAVPSVRKSDVIELSIPLPPIAQQDEIVAELEKQFSRLDEAVANLQRVKANLKRYKASVLKDAVEGRLVPTEAELARREGRSFETGEQLLLRILETRRKEWKGRGKYKEPEPANLSTFSMPPDGWHWFSIDQLTSVVTDGEHITPTRAPSGVLLLSARNVLNGRLALDDVDYVPEQEYMRISQRLSIQEGDVLLSCSGTVGRTCVVPAGMRFGLVRSVAVLRTVHVLPEFLCFQLQSPFGQSQINDRKTQTAQANLFQGKIRQLAVAVPPIDEQRRLVAEAERRLSLIRSVETEVNANVKRAQSLRQATLSKAFGGSNG